VRKNKKKFLEFGISEVYCNYINIPSSQTFRSYLWYREEGIAQKILLYLDLGRGRKRRRDKLHNEELYD
jgi:hypothetical protein